MRSIVKHVVNILMIASMIVVLTTSFMLVTKTTAQASDSYQIDVNQRYTGFHKKGSEHILKFNFSIPENGKVIARLYVDVEHEDGHNILGWASGLYDKDIVKCYADEYAADDSSYSVYEDDDGKKWWIYEFSHCRLPAGDYCFYMGAPGSMLNAYGHFDIMIEYQSESGNSAVEREFNDTRNTANDVTINNTYYGNNHKNDVDYFRITFDEKTDASLDFYNRSGSYDMKFCPRVVDSEGQVIHSGTSLGEVEMDDGTVFDKYQFEMNVDPGTYYFKVWNFYDSTVDYHFNVNVEENEDAVEDEDFEDTDYDDSVSDEHECSYDNYDEYVVPASKNMSGDCTQYCECGRILHVGVIPRITTIKLTKATYVYNGKVRKPNIIVKNAYGTRLVEGKDYTVSKPSGRKNVGTYTYKIRFKGNYTGTQNLKLKIKPAAPVIKAPKATKRAVTVKWKKVTKQATGYQVMIARNKTFTTGVKSAYIKNTKTVSKKYAKLKSKKTYYMRVRTYKTVKGVKHYSAWSAVKKVKTK